MAHSALVAAVLLEGELFIPRTRSYGVVRENYLVSNVCSETRFGDPQNTVLDGGELGFHSCDGDVIVLRLRIQPCDNKCAGILPRNILYRLGKFVNVMLVAQVSPCPLEQSVIDFVAGVAANDGIILFFGAGCHMYPLKVALLGLWYQ